LWTRLDASGTTTLTELKSIYPEAYQVPEPATLALMGIAGFVITSRRLGRFSSELAGKVRKSLTFKTE
jgi:hypothetical protein